MPENKEEWDESCLLVTKNKMLEQRKNCNWGEPTILSDGVSKVYASSPTEDDPLSKLLAISEIAGVSVREVADFLMKVENWLDNKLDATMTEARVVEETKGKNGFPLKVRREEPNVVTKNMNGRSLSEFGLWDGLFGLERFCG